MRDYKSAIEQMMAGTKNKGIGLDAIENLLDKTKVNDLKDPYKMARFCKENKLSYSECLTLLAWIVSQMSFLDNITADDNITYKDAVDNQVEVSVKTIILHRVNYILHERMVIVYGLVENNKRFKFTAKKAYKDAEKIWDDYLESRRRKMERSAWTTLLDHLRIVNATLSPYMLEVYEAVRNNMIRLGYKDVELKAQVEMVCMLSKVVMYTFRQFFNDFKEDCGVDYSGVFRNDDMTDMIDRFALLCDSMGIEMERDGDGMLSLKGYNPDDYIRFQWAWKRFMKAMRNEDLMDKTALDAINLNPNVQEEYHHILEEEEEKQMQESIGKLSDKFKVKTV